jgi:hypothetical protein
MIEPEVLAKLKNDPVYRNLLLAELGMLDKSSNLQRKLSNSSSPASYSGKVVRCKMFTKLN